MTEHNIFQEIQEDMERQKLEALWRRYGPYVVVAAVFVVLITAGITIWNNWQSSKHQEATAGLTRIMNKYRVDEVPRIEALENFAKDNSGTPQAAFAQLHAAALFAKKGEIEKAVQVYDVLAKDGSVEMSFRQFADLMAVRIQMDTADPALLEKRLAPLLTENGPWRFTAKEYQGYLAMKAGDRPRARQIFTELSQNAGTPPSLSARATDLQSYLSE